MAYDHMFEAFRMHQKSRKFTPTLKQVIISGDKHAPILMKFGTPIVLIILDIFLIGFH